MACGTSSLTRDQTQAPCIGRAESQPLDHQGSPQIYILSDWRVTSRGRMPQGQGFSKCGPHQQTAPTGRNTKSHPTFLKERLCRWGSALCLVISPGILKLRTLVLSRGYQVAVHSIMSDFLRPHAIHADQELQWGFSAGSAGKESACNAGDPASIPGLGRSPEEGNGTLVFLPGKSHGQRSLAGYNPRGSESWTRLRD